MEKIKPKELGEFESVQYWMKSLKTQGNRRKCLESFPKFMNWVQEKGIAENPDNVIASRIEDLKLPHEDPKRYRWEDYAKEFYHGYYDELEKEGRSTWTARTCLSAVQSFFAHHRLDLQFRKGELKVAETKREKRELSLDEVRALYESAERFLDKAIILVLAQSGMSEIDVCNLDVEDVVDELTKPPFYYNSARTKTKHKGARIQTCISPEACEEIAKYLKTRGNPREGPLFVTGTKGKGQRMTTRTINIIVKRVAERAEINGNFLPKDLRDFYGDCLDHAGVSGKVKELMMGRVPPGAERYYKTSKYTILEAYLKAYQYLKINTIPRPKEDKIEIADAFARFMKVMTSPNPKEEMGKWVDELRGVSTDLIGPTTFEAILKQKLQEVGA